MIGHKNKGFLIINKLCLDGTDGVQPALFSNYMDGDYAIHNKTIACIDSFGSGQQEDYNIRWTRNLEDLQDTSADRLSANFNNNTLTIHSSGFYCCHLSRREDVSNSSLTFCATVLIEGQLDQMSNCTE